MLWYNVVVCDPKRPKIGDDRRFPRRLKLPFWEGEFYAKLKSQLMKYFIGAK